MINILNGGRVMPVRNNCRNRRMTTMRRSVMLGGSLAAAQRSLSMAWHRGLTIGLTITLMMSNPLVVEAETFKVSSTLQVSSLALNADYDRGDGVFGADNREPLEWGKTTKVPDGWVATNSYDYPSVGYNPQSEFSTKRIVRILSENRDFICTGSVVAPTIVLTAAHCLRWNSKWLDSSKKRPRYIEAWNGQTYEVDRRIVPKRYLGTPLSNSPRTTTADQWSLDAGLIYLSKRIDLVTEGFFDIVGTREAYQISWIIAGFHGDVEQEKPKQLVVELSKSSRSCVGNIRPIAERGRGGRNEGSWFFGYGTVIVHKCDTSPGSSGSPLVVYGDTVVGVHVASGPDKYALAVNLTEKRGPFDWIRRHVAKNREEYGWRRDDQGKWQGTHEVPWRNL